MPIRQRLSIALQRGNALIAKLGLGLSWRQDRRPARLNRARRLLGSNTEKKIAVVNKY